MLLRSQLHPGDGGPPPDPVPAPDLEAPAQVLADDGLVDVDELGVESSVDGLDGVQGTGASSACACDEEPAEDSARDSVYGSAVWEHRVGAELIDLVEGLRVKLRPKLAGAGDVEDALDHVLGEVRLAGWGTHARWWLRCDDCRMAWLYTIGKRKAANWWKERSNEQARARLLAAETPFEAPVSAPMPGPAPGGTLLERLSQVHGLGALTEVEAKIRRTPTLRRVLERATVDLRSGREPDLRPAVAMLVPLPRWAHHRLRTTVPVPLSVREAVRVGVAPDTSRAHKELTHLWAANQWRLALVGSGSLDTW